MTSEDKTYTLGVDLGTTYTAAAVRRDGVGRMLPLGVDRAEMPSVLAVADEDVLVGDAAERRSVSHPQQIAREFKRRIGDPTPVIVGGAPWSAEALTARLLRHVLDAATSLEGSPPDALVVTHPANWHVFKIDRLRQAVLIAGVEEVAFIAEPVAAAKYYASESRIFDGQQIAIFDLGGGTFDAAVVGAHQGGFHLIGRPKGLEQLGGTDLDQAIFAHVLEVAGCNLADLEDTKENRSAVARLRDDCRKAKEHLSSDTSVSVPVMLPGLHTEVRLNRTEFESMIQAPLGDALGVLDLSIQDAGLTPGDLDGVLLVGGGSRIPLVTQLLSSHLGVPVLADAHPKHTVALGACVTAGLEPPVGIAPLSSDTPAVIDLSDSNDGGADETEEEVHVFVPAAVDLSPGVAAGAQAPLVVAARGTAVLDDAALSEASRWRKPVAAVMIAAVVVGAGFGLSQAGSGPEDEVAASSASSAEEEGDDPDAASDDGQDAASTSSMAVGVEVGEEEPPRGSGG